MEIKLNIYPCNRKIYGRSIITHSHCKWSVNALCLKFAHLSSIGSQYGEIDFEFLGNSTWKLYMILDSYTNQYTQQKGGWKQQFHMWFDPNFDFLNYTINCNQRRVQGLVKDMNGRKMSWTWIRKWTKTTSAARYSKTSVGEDPPYS